MGLHGRRGAKAANVVALEALVRRPLRNKFGARHAAALASAALVVLFMPLVLVCLASGGSGVHGMAHARNAGDSRGP